MTFWILTSVMALGLALMLALAVLRGRSGGAPAAAYDLQVYREQLKDVERDLARGVINEADAERIRTEVSRRILAADAQVQAEASGQAQPRTLSIGIAAGTGIVLIAGTFFLYQDLGSPGYQDVALADRIAQAEERRETRPAQAEAEQSLPPRPAPQADEDYLKLLERLRATVAERPDDIQGHTLLAQHEYNLGNFKAAYQAKSREIELLKGDASPADYTELAEMMIAATGGYVSPEAEGALNQALRRDPNHGPARYYWGLMLAQVDRPDLAFGLWDQTLRNGPEGAPWINAIRQNIEDMAWRAGIQYQLPEPGTTAPGPDADDVAAAQDMTPEERQEMIRGMVDRLSDRLATDGGAPDEWARLIAALGVLGERDRAQAILKEAQQVFAGNDAALAMIVSAGIQAGLIE
jgi:cytochrome c-type biogenesis protein CcmH